MADEKKSVIIDLKFDVSKFTKDAATAATSVKKLKDEQTNLKKSGQENSVQFQQNAAEIKRLNSVVAENQKAVRNLTTANEANAGSNEQLKAQLSVMTLEYNKLSESERNNSARGKELHTQINQTTATLKENEKAVGDNRREVGNYALIMTDLKAEMKAAKGEAFAMGQQYGVASKEFQEASARAGELADKIKDTNEATKVFTTGSKFEQFGNSLKGVGGDLASLDFEGASEKAQGLLTISKSMTFKEAISGATSFGSTMKSVGIALITNPVFLIAAALIAVGVAAKSMYDTFQDGNKILDETKDAMMGVRLETNAIIKSSRDMVLQNKLANKEITQAEFDRANTSNKLNDDILANEKKRREEKLKAEEEFNKAKDTIVMNGLKATSMASYNLLEEKLLTQKNEALLVIDKEFNDKKKAIITNNVIERAGNFIKESQAEKDAIEKANEEKLALVKQLNTSVNDDGKEARELNEQNIKAANERLEQIRIENIKDIREKTFAELDNAHQKELDTITGNSLEEQSLKLALDQQLRDKKAELTALFKQEDFDKKLEERELELENQLILADEDSAQRLLILEQQRAMELAQKELTQSQKDVINKKYNDIEKADAQKLLQIKLSLRQQELSATAGFVTAFAGLMKEGSVEQKLFMSAGAIVNTYAAAAAALAPPPIGAGPILGPVIAATAVAQGLANVAKINGVKFAKGGVFGGQSHSNGGTKGYFEDGTQIEVERGELFAVVNKRNTSMLNYLSDLNSFGGNGKSFFASGGTKTFANGGIGFGNVSTSIDQSQNGIEQFMAAIENLPTPVVAVQDINEVQYSNNQVQVRANL